MSVDQVLTKARGGHSERMARATRGLVPWVLLAGLAASQAATALTLNWGTATTDLSPSGKQATELQLDLSDDGSKAAAIWRNSTDTKIEAAFATIADAAAIWSSPNSGFGIGSMSSDPQMEFASDGTRATAV